MVDDNKNHLGSKLHDLEKAREDIYAAEQDKALLEKLRKRTSHQDWKCPHCGQPLATSSRAGAAMMACPQGAGVWLEQAALEHLLEGRK